MKKFICEKYRKEWYSSSNNGNGCNSCKSPLKEVPYDEELDENKKKE